jgi:hypothetical protein
VTFALGSCRALLPVYPANEIVESVKVTVAPELGMPARREISVEPDIVARSDRRALEVRAVRRSRRVKPNHISLSKA